MIALPQRAARARASATPRRIGQCAFHAIADQPYRSELARLDCSARPAAAPCQPVIVIAGQKYPSKSSTSNEKLTQRPPVGCPLLRSRAVELLQRCV